MTRYHYFKLVTMLSLRLPRRALYFVARVLTTVNRLVDRPKRESVLENLRVILGPTASERRIRREARLVFYNFGKFIAEFFGLERFGGPFIDEHVDIVGEDYVKAALARGKGVILNTGHLSNWELGAAAYARKGYPVTGVALLHPEPELSDYFRRQRRSRGYDTIPTEGAFLKCVEALRRNEVICFVGDRDVGLGGVEVEFFGRPTLFPQGPARIALASGATIVPGFVIRRSDDSFVVSMEPPLEVPARGSRREKAAEMTQQYARAVERYVRSYPTQWGVFHRYWPEEGAAAAAGADM